MPTNRWHDGRPQLASYIYIYMLDVVYIYSTIWGHLSILFAGRFDCKVNRKPIKQQTKRSSRKISPTVCVLCVLSVCLCAKCVLSVFARVCVCILYSVCVCAKPLTAHVAYFNCKWLRLCCPNNDNILLGASTKWVNNEASNAAAYLRSSIGEVNIARHVFTRRGKGIESTQGLKSFSKFSLESRKVSEIKWIETMATQLKH